MRFLSLFSGIGGLDLGLEWAGWECVAQCEREPFCREVLAMHWPGVLCFDDVTTLDPSGLGPIDAVVGGFPCQDISSAGKGAGIEGSRSGLWKEMLRVIREAGPRWVVAENVPALRTRGADVVLGDLEGLGYSCWPLVVGAVHAGAPHRRQRVFIVAHSPLVDDPSDGSGGPAAAGRGEGVADRDGPGLQGRPTGADVEPGRQVEPVRPEALADSQGVRQRGQGYGEHEAGRLALGRGVRFPPAQSDLAGWRSVLETDLGLAPALPVEHQIRGVADGLPERVVRRWRKETLKAYGNSVVPQVAEAIGRAINAVERGTP